jgi:hypothetical protein
MISPEPNILIRLSLPTIGDGVGVGVGETTRDIEGVTVILGVTDGVAVTDAAGVELILGVTVIEGVTVILGVIDGVTLILGVTEGDGAGPDPDICTFAAPCPLLLYTLLTVCSYIATSVRY